MARKFPVIVVSLLLLGPVLAACAGDPRASATLTRGVSLAAVSALPKDMQDAPVRVREAYQFAVANPEALKNVPCYCGCGAMGHTSNLSCYIKDGAVDGQTPAPVPGSAAVPGEAGHSSITFDSHALGCSLCVDIAQDVMRMTGEGKAPQDIRAAIVATYSKYGPPNQ